MTSGSRPAGLTTFTPCTMFSSWGSNNLHHLYNVLCQRHCPLLDFICLIRYTLMLTWASKVHLQLIRSGWFATCSGEYDILAGWKFHLACRLATPVGADPLRRVDLGSYRRLVQYLSVSLYPDDCRCYNTVQSVEITQGYSTPFVITTQVTTPSALCYPHFRGTRRSFCSTKLHLIVPPWVPFLSFQFSKIHFDSHERAGDKVLSTSCVCRQVVRSVVECHRNTWTVFTGSVHFMSLPHCIED